MKKILLKIILIVFSLFILTACDEFDFNNPGENTPGDIEDTPNSENDKPNEKEEETLPDNFGYEDDINLDHYEIIEDEIYITKNEVALYIYFFDKLPSNYLTKSEAKPHISNYWTKDNLLSIGGDNFQNRERLLPIRPNGTYKELDIGYNGGKRNALRIVYANKYEIYYTKDHYDSFIWLDTEVMIWKQSYSMD